MDVKGGVAHSGPQHEGPIHNMALTENSSVCFGYLQVARRGHPTRHTPKCKNSIPELITFSHNCPAAPAHVELAVAMLLGILARSSFTMNVSGLRKGYEVLYNI